jgi:hypothetical protein
MVQTFRVSHLAAYARWREDEESDVGWLISQIRTDEPSEAMLKGTAFHRALETIKDGWEGHEVSALGYKFLFTCDVEISLPQTRETRRAKDYGGIIVSGQADAIGGKIIIDHKTTSRFDAENYLEGWQHKFYLDIFEADRFDWYCWVMEEIKEDSKEYEVFEFHQLSQYRYPELERDCRELALDFKRFAARYLPDYNFQPHQEKCEPKPEWKMSAVKGLNLVGVGWRDGILRCAFAGKYNGAKFYQFAGVPEEIKDDLLRNPYPETRWAYLKQKHGFKGTAEAA